MEEKVHPSNEDIIALTAEIVAAYVGNNPTQMSSIPAFITDVHRALSAAHETPEAAVPEEDAKPAVPVGRSVRPDYIICLEDGKKFKSLKRHLRTAFDMTPEEYRNKWRLPADYPMVAPNYAKFRSEMAKRNGLGRKAAE